MIRAIILFLVIFYTFAISHAQENANENPSQFNVGTSEDSSTAEESNGSENNEEVPFSTSKSPALDAPKISQENKDKAADVTPSSDKDPQANFTNGVLLQGLNKITARTSKLEVSTAEPFKFGNLSIILRSCWKSPPEEAPESKALLEMWEEIPGEARKKVFSGWMFSSSPLISAPEHPVYDITVLECIASNAGKASKK